MQHVALAGFRRMPGWVRRGAVRLGTPSFTVGAVCAIEHDGRLLMLRQPHRPGWTLPGGLLSRGEDAPTAVVREVREETGLDLTVGLPVTTVVVPDVRRVDIVFRVCVDAEFPVRPGGEAVRAAWVDPHGDGVTDSSTRDIIAALDRLSGERPYAGVVHR